MVYLPKAPSYSEQSAEYDWSKTFEVESTRRNKKHPIGRRLTKLISRFRTPPSEAKLRRVLRYASSGSLLDFGCDTGGFLRSAARHFAVTGLEISVALASKAAERVPEATIICAPATKAKLPSEAFDVITMFSYLEHEHSPLLALKAAWEALKADCILIVKCPNYASINRRLRGPNWCGFRFPDHLNYFTPRTLEQIIRRAGFEPIIGGLFDRLPTSDNIYMAARKSQQR